MLKTGDYKDMEGMTTTFPDIPDAPSCGHCNDRHWIAVLNMAGGGSIEETPCVRCNPEGAIPLPSLGESPSTIEGVVKRDEFDVVLDVIGRGKILDCECGWEGHENETDDGECPDCGMQVCIVGED